jgi:hypothetical protein
VLVTVILTLSQVAGDLQPLPAPRLWRPPVVKLVDAGAAPRAPLRYTLRKGLSADATFDSGGSWRIVNTQGTQSATLPTLSTPFHVTVAAPEQWTFRFQAGGAKTANGAAADVLAEQTVQALDGVNGTVTFDDRGLAQKLAIYPSPTDPQHQQNEAQIEVRSYYAMEMARTAFMHLCTPFPSEPVGLGAVWEVERPATRGSISYTEVTRFTLRAADKKSVTLEVHHGGKPDPYGVIAPEQLDLLVTGEGETKIEFSRPLPVRLDETITLHALTGPKSAQRVEHEGALASHLRLEENARP